MTDKSTGLLTTHKLQTLIDLGVNPVVKTRRDLARILNQSGEKISRHGVEAWFRHVDSNYNLNRTSLADSHPSYNVPKRRWKALLDVFGLPLHVLDKSDQEFSEWCLNHISNNAPQTQATPITNEPTADLVGRREAYRSFSRLVNNAIDGESGCLLLEGDAGHGKTFFQHACWAALDQAPVIRFRIQCENNSSTPFQPIFALLRLCIRDNPLIGSNWQQAIFELSQLDGDSSTDASEQVKKVFNELSTLIVEMNLNYPIVFFVDDAQWIDDVTARFLHFLHKSGNEKQDHGCAFVIATRPQRNQFSQQLESILTSYSTEQVTVGPLSFKEMYQLVTQTLRGSQPNQAFAELVTKYSLGNPLIAVDMVRSLDRDGLLKQDGNGVSCIIEDAEILEYFDAERPYSRLVNGLSNDAQAILLTLAAYDQACSMDILQSIYSDKSVGWILDRLEEGEHTGAIAYEQDRYKFRHAVIRDAVYNGVSTARRAHAHAAIAGSLRQAKNGISEFQYLQIAHHLRNSMGFVPNSQVAEYCYKAAKAAKSLRAWDQMIVFAQTALKIIDEITPARRAELLDWTGGASHMTGNAIESIQLLEQARNAFNEIGDAESAGNVLAQIVRVRANFGLVERDWMDDVEELHKLAEICSKINPELASRMYDALTARYMYARAPAQALQSATQGFDILRTSGASEAKSHAGVAAAVASLEWSKLDQAEDFLYEAEDSAIACADQENIDRARQRLTLIALSRGHFNLVRSLSTRLRRSQRLITGTGEFGLVLSANITLHVLEGNYDEAERAYAEGMSLIQSSGYIWAAPLLVTAIVGCRLRQGEVTQARQAISALTQDAKPLFHRTSKRLKNLTSEDNAEPDHPLRIIKLSVERGIDLYSVGLICAEMPLAIRGDNQAYIDAAIEALLHAYGQGARVATCWPKTLPETLAEAYDYCGDSNAAAHYTSLHHDLLSRI